MKTPEFIKKILSPELEPPPEDYFRRNSGKKLMATILEETPEQIKQKEAETAL